MKKTYPLLVVLAMILQVSWGQQDVRSLAINYLADHAKELQLAPTDYQGAVVSDQVYSTHNGVTHVYLQQAVDGIPVYNAIASIAIKDGKVVHQSNNYITQLQEKIKGSRAPSISSEQAVTSAAQHLGIASPKLEVLRSAGTTTVYQGGNISRSEIPVKPMYTLTTAGELRLTYDLNIDTRDNADWWSIRVDATTGQVIDQHNWTVYCAPNVLHNHTAACRTHQHHDNFTTLHQSISGAAGVDGAQYRVYPLPAESPIHGPRVLVSEPAIVTASPYGWHDTDGSPGAEYTITRGNNVHAYTDLTDSNTSSGNEPDGGDNLLFDHPHDLSVEPGEQLDAATTNLFYMNNMMHDLFFQFGFDEQSGNFQTRNYSGQGQPTDDVQAEALDGSGTNNANFATPPDGAAGRMQMFLWGNPSGYLTIESPETIAGLIAETGESFDLEGGIDWGVNIRSSDADIAGPVAIAEDRFGTTSCRAIEADLTGKVALIDRGGCDFSLKAARAQDAGAIGVLIVNIVGVNGGDGEETIGMNGGDRATEITIPVLFIKKSDGDLIRGQLSNNEDVVVRFKVVEPAGASQLDASFDNGVIAHEYGHGISNRLTGGPSQAGCLGNAEQMGEGWSDFFTLVTAVEPGDTGTDRRGIGTFVNAQNTNAGGIRQYPYSTDMSINPHTFTNVASVTGVHAIGSIWCAMLWDLYWAMVDKYGYSEDWADTESGNYRAIQLVMDGMKLQSCSPGFIAGRDGILAADQLNYDGDNTELIWTVFARRGLGFFADGGNTNSSVDGQANFDLPPLLVEELKITRTTADLVNVEEVHEVQIDIINHIPEAQTAVFVSDELAEGLSYVAGSGTIEPTVNGQVLTFDIGNMEYKEEQTITYRVTPSTELVSRRLYYDDFEEDRGWEPLDEKESGFTWFDDEDFGRNNSIGWGAYEYDALETDQTLTSEPIQIVGEDPVLRFFHRYETTPSANGGFVSVAVDGSEIFRAIPAESFLRNAYTTEVQYGLFAIPALGGFSGSSAGEFVDSYIDMSAYKGQTVQLRFRFGTQETVEVGLRDPAWSIDDLELIDLQDMVNTACIGNQDGIANCSSTFTIVEPSISVDAEDINKDYFDVNLYPNPASDFVVVAVTSPTETEVQISLRSIDGRIVQTLSTQVNSTQSIETLSIGNLSSGVYLVEVRTEDKLSIRKVIIQ